MRTLHVQFQLTTGGIVKAGVIVALLFAVASYVSAGSSRKAATQQLPQTRPGEPSAGEIVLPGLRLKRGDLRDSTVQKLSMLYDLLKL